MNIKAISITTTVMIDKMETYRKNAPVLPRSRSREKAKIERCMSLDQRALQRFEPGRPDKLVTTFADAIQFLAATDSPNVDIAPVNPHTPATIVVRGKRTRSCRLSVRA